MVIMRGRKRSRQGLLDGGLRRELLDPLGVDGEVHHHDAVLLHDADQQDDADQRDDGQVEVRAPQHEQRTHTRRRQGRKNRQRVDVALVEHAQDDVDDNQRAEDEQRLALQGRLERLRGALERAVHRRRHPHVLRYAVERIDGLAERDARLQG